MSAVTTLRQVNAPVAFTGAQLALIRRTVAKDTNAAIAKVPDALMPPAGALGAQLDTVARLIAGGMPTRVYSVSLGHPAAIPLGPRGSAPYSIAIADMNRDSLRDIVVGNQEAPGLVVDPAGCQPAASALDASGRSIPQMGRRSVGGDQNVQFVALPE